MKLSALFGVLFFGVAMGFRTLDPTHIRWLMDGDMINHYLGWEFFRHQAWTFPLAKLTTYMDPIGTSVIHTDSIPLFALFFKLLDPFLSAPFQYFGIWMLMCFILQSVFAFRIFQALGLPYRGCLFGSFLIGSAPTFIFRIAHHALCAHWLILACFDFYFRQKKSERPHAVGLLVLLVVAAFTHPYLLVIVAALVAACFLKFLIESPGQRLRVMIDGFVMGLILVGSVSVLGYFPMLGTGASGYGLYVSDLLAFFNPLEFSRFFPAIRYGPGNYEGFAYLGLGGMMLFLGCAAHSKRILKFSRDPLFWICLFLAYSSLAFALKIANHSYLSLDGVFPFLKGVLSTFRASGRFVWPFYYLVFIFLIRYTMTFYRPKIAYVLFALAIVLQFADFKLYTDPRFPTAPMLTLNLPKSSVESVKRLVFVSPVLFGCKIGVDKKSYARFAVEAAVRGWSMNSGYTSREDYKAAARYCVQLMEDLQSGRFSPNTLYVFDSENRDFARSPVLDCTEALDVLACTVKSGG